MLPCEKEKDINPNMVLLFLVKMKHKKS